jgi:L-asparaginase
MRQVTLVTTGGTIEKTYDEQTGELSNRRTLVRRMLEELRLEETDVTVRELMSKDSLDMTPEDRRRIVEAVQDAAGEKHPECGGVVILHGTDTLCDTGELLAHELPEPRVPVVLTGAWRPFEMKRSDALQNLTEAIFATGALRPGIYCVAHGRTLRFPGVRKDRTRGTFVALPDCDEGSAGVSRDSGSSP